MISVEIHNGQSCLPCDTQRLESAVRMVLEDTPLRRAKISLAVVDDATIRELHARYLGQDEPTDVLSFVLEHRGGCLEGEVVASAETAAAMAPHYGWPATDELLLYVIHGALHLAGYDDDTEEQRSEIRRRERLYLGRFGLEGRYKLASPEEGDSPIFAARKSGQSPAARKSGQSTAARKSGQSPRNEVP